MQNCEFNNLQEHTFIVFHNCTIQQRKDRFRYRGNAHFYPSELD